MVTESRDRVTGIYRHEYGTVNARQCRENIEATGLVKDRVALGDAIKYLIDFKGYPIDVTSTPTRTVMFCVNRLAMSRFFDLIKGDASHGWEYDGSNKFDYAPADRRGSR